MPRKSNYLFTNDEINTIMEAINDACHLLHVECIQQKKERDEEKLKKFRAVQNRIMDEITNSCGRFWGEIEVVK